MAAPRVLVCGGRDFWDVPRLEHRLYHAWVTCGGFSVLMHGKCPRGADRLAGLWAQTHNIPVLEFPADWDRYGKRAGMIRNQRMLDEGKPNLVIAFPGGPGTANMVARANLAGVMVWEA